MNYLVFRVSMSDVYLPPDRVAQESHCRGMQKYQEMYNESIDDPKKFWMRICQQFYWKKTPSEGFNILGLTAVIIFSKL